MNAQDTASAERRWWVAAWTTAAVLLPLMLWLSGDFGVTWVDDPPTSDTSTWRSDQDEDAQMAAATRVHSCEYCAWGNFGNEGSEIDLYTYAALHVEIPPFGKGLRGGKKPAKRTPAKRARAPRKRKPDQE